jgi:hypothetical protein
MESVDNSAVADLTWDLLVALWEKARPSNRLLSTPFTLIPHFKNLWNVNFSGCQLNFGPSDLQGLSLFGALGTVDLSTTAVTLLALQNYLRPIYIQQLRVLMCPKVALELMQSLNDLF